MKDRIVVIGSLNYDIVLKLPGLPALGETQFADDCAFAAGGKGANQAVQAAKLGVPTSMVGCVGSDAMGDYLLATAARHGVDTAHVRRAEGPSGLGVVHALPDGSVFANIVRGANYALTEADVDAALPALERAYLAIFQMEIPLPVLRRAMRRAKEAGCLVLLNAAPALPFADADLALADLLVVNEVEAGFYAGCAIDSVAAARREAVRLAARLDNRCVFTLGKLGAVGADSAHSFFVPPLPVRAIETTGAGDSFIGGLGYALGPGQELEDACRFATRCSAVTVCRIGAQDSMPTLAELDSAAAE